MKRAIVLASITLLATLAPAFAGPLVRSEVSARANWVVHINHEMLVNSQTGQLIRAELAKTGLEQKLADFKNIFSFHPLDDIRDATLYGIDDDQDKAVVLIDGSFNADTLVSLVTMNPEYAQVKYGDLTVHSWVDENKKDPDKLGKRMYGCIPKPGLVVMSSGLDAVKQAVDVLEGSAPNAGGGRFGQGSLDATGAFITVAVNTVGRVAGDQEKAAVLKNAEELGAAIGEDKGKFYINLSVKAATGEAALNIKKVADGMIAFLALAGGKEPALADLAKKLSLSSVDRTVTLYFEATPQEVVDSLKKQWQAEKQKRAEAAQ